MDPAVVDSAEFGQLWKIAFNNEEQFYAKPLVYTPTSTGVQLVFLASSQNWIRTLDAKSGVLINSRQVQTPFLQSDIGCTDIPNYIGIIGTPVIDPDTDIVYFFAKTYIPNFRAAGDTGTYNGVYYFYAVNFNTLEDIDGFPILVDGSVSQNDPLKYFIGGVILQRPSLTQIGSVVYGAFGGHCDLFNYTGIVLGVDINEKKIVTNFATEAGPLVSHDLNWDDNGGGGQGGIWMSGMAMATDGARLFFVTGNGDGHENQGTPASGSSGCTTLGEAVVNLGIDDAGVVSLTDYFQPYDYENMDAGDEDFGSGGIALLDPAYFSGTGVERIGVTAGKNGKIYIVNADNLGGYKLGVGQTDGILQTIETEKAVFGGSGSYPLEGGYIYSTPVGYPTYVYKLGFDGSGGPVFSQVGQSHEDSAGRVGVGIPTITTYQGKEGTAILWMTDPDAGLRAWYAVPGADGYLKTITLPQVNGLNKFQRPAFGDTRLYVTDANGVLYCLGSPVDLPLNCTSPVDFGTVALGSSETETVTCTANIAITSVDGATVGTGFFEVDNSSLPQGALAAGATFNFPVTWNLTDASVTDAANASYGNTSPGVKSTALTLYTTNAVTGYATLFPISLTGTEVSSKAYLSLTPVEVDFGGIVLTGNDSSGGTISSPFSIANAGLANLTITGYAYTTEDLDDDNIDYTNSTEIDGTWDLGYGFTSTNLPLVGTILGSGDSISVDAVFTPINGTGAYQSYFFVWTNGGTGYTILEGSASTAPIADFAISNGEGGWLPSTNLLMDFGDVAPGGNATRQIRICNSGGSVLTVTKSKPPSGVIRATAPGIDLHESQQIAVGSCAYGTVLFEPNTEPPNEPNYEVSNTWTLNTDDLNFGVHVIDAEGTVVDRIVGPTLANGSAEFQYLGCYLDGTNGRLLSQEPYEDDDNSNGRCQEACLEGGYIFAGTEYQTECWCGDTAPSSEYFYNETDSKCTFACSGDSSQACGGEGGYISIYYDVSKYTPGDTTGTDPPDPADPLVVSSVGSYISIGCYSEGNGSRALTSKEIAAPSSGQTVESCAAGCAGYTYFGVEYSDECYCGNTLSEGSAPEAGDASTSGCSMTCSGNSTEYCGGENRLNIYQANSSTLPTTFTSSSPSSTSSAAPDPLPTSDPVIVAGNANFTYVACYAEPMNGVRALANLVVANDSMTVEICLESCYMYQYAGLEYGRECWCGSDLNSNALEASSESQCDMACGGNSTEYCGAGSRLSLYELKGQILEAAPDFLVHNATSFSKFLPASLSSNITVIDSTLISTVSSDNSTSAAASTAPFSNATNSVIITVSARPMSPSGDLASATSGYCGNGLQQSSTPTHTGCSSPCSGNTTTLCGGADRLSLYNLTSYLPPTTVKAVGAYAAQGCYTASSSLFPGSTSNYTNATSMSVEACVAICQLRSPSSSYAALEASTTCYCADELGSNVEVVDDASKCDMPCPGNGREFCGGWAALNVYLQDEATLDSAGVPRSMNEDNGVLVQANSTNVAVTARNLMTMQLRSRTRRGEAKRWLS
ncbi:MAG: hypothetical protein M1819_001498 [Sarea resinae]|nr:MAG: hypothetical protein M1819_001498 [Sarea resinae]